MTNRLVCAASWAIIAAFIGLSAHLLWQGYHRKPDPAPPVIVPVQPVPIPPPTKPDDDGKKRPKLPHRGEA